MAERAQLQYTPVIGPVWTEPVAEKLAWLPRAQQPARALPPNRLGWYCRPEFAALYRPEGLQWVSEDSYAGRTSARARRDWTVLQDAPSAPPFDPQRLEWLPQGQQSQARAERRQIAAFAAPQFEALYRPDRLQWQPEDGYFGRSARSSRLDWTVFQEPIAAAVFDPQSLEWLPEDAYFGRRARSSRIDWTVFQEPITSAVFDPRSLEWMPRGAQPRIPVERRLSGAFAQPPFVALYNPARLEWVLSGLQPQRKLPSVLRGAWVSDPAFFAPAAFKPVGVRIVLTGADRSLDVQTGDSRLTFTFEERRLDS